jgi:peptide/nickel transport system permease protein
MTKANIQYSAKAEVSNLYIRRSFYEKAIINLKKAPVTAWIGMIIVTFYFFVATFAPLLAPYGEAEIFKVPYAPWDSVHIFGTDRLGRDIFSRLIYGARNTMGIALITTFLAFLIGVGLGLLSAILSGWVDQILARFVDILMAIPSLIFALMLLSIFGSTALNLILIIETFSIGILILFIFKIEQFAKSIVPGVCGWSSCVAFLTIPLQPKGNPLRAD